jgi:hypothetical protein
MWLEPRDVQGLLGHRVAVLPWLALIDDEQVHLAAHGMPSLRVRTEQHHALEREYVDKALDPLLQGADELGRITSGIEDSNTTRGSGLHAR